MTDFEKAFAAAKKAGKKTFTWKGKEYNTKIKELTTELSNAKHPVIPPTPEQSKKDKGQPQGYLGENAWKNRASTGSEIDIESRRKNLKDNKQKIKKFFGLEKNVKDESRKKKLGGFRDTSESWIESPNFSIDD